MNETGIDAKNVRARNKHNYVQTNYKVCLGAKDEGGAFCPVVVASSILCSQREDSWGERTPFYWLAVIKGKRRWDFDWFSLGDWKSWKRGDRAVDRRGFS